MSIQIQHDLDLKNLCRVTLEKKCKTHWDFYNLTIDLFDALMLYQNDYYSKETFEQCLHIFTDFLILHSNRIYNKRYKILMEGTRVLLNRTVTIENYEKMNGKSMILFGEPLIIRND